MDFKVFTKEIEAMRAYWHSLRDLQMEIDKIEHEEQGVKAIRYDREPTTPNPNAEQFRLELIEKKAELEKMVDRTLLKYNPIKASVIDTLEKLSEKTREILCEKYGLVYQRFEHSTVAIFKEEQTYEELNERYHYSNLWRHIKSEVEKL